MLPPFTATLRHNETLLGSGFLVHRSGLLATCYHVLRHLGEPVADKPLEVCFLGEERWSPARATQHYDQRHDVALLQLDTPRPDLAVPQLVSAGGGQRGEAFTLTAYGVLEDSGRSYAYLSALGHLVGPAERDGVGLLHLESRQILRGMSGGPIFMPAVNGVIGILSERYTIDPLTSTFMRDTAWATPVAALECLDGRLQPRRPPQTRSDGQGNVWVGGDNNGNIATSGGSIVVHSRPDPPEDND